MSKYENGPLLWRDLAAEDVYMIAHQENETREIFGRLVGQSDYDSSASLAAAQEVQDSFEHYSDSWLVGQAVLRGMSVESLPEVEVDGDTLRELRQMTGLSQRELATRMRGVSQPMLSRAERGQAPRSTMFKVYWKLRNFSDSSNASD